MKNRLKAWLRLSAYGFFALPLALVALPLYVVIPQLYAERFGLSLTLIGAILLLTRLADAFFDPLIGWWIDRARGTHAFVGPLKLGIPLLALGFCALFLPPQAVQHQAAAWLSLALLLTYSGFSLTTITHQSWGAALTQIPDQRVRLNATRETFGLIGVLLAALVQQTLNALWLTSLFIGLLLLAAWVLLGCAQRPAVVLSNQSATVPYRWAAFTLPFNNPHFRWLFAVFVFNGIAAAVPATLFLFFVADQLRSPQYSGAFLLIYFLAAAASMPFWVKMARRLGEARAWGIAMLLALVAFVGAFWLVPGALLAFALICLISGFALGADLALPPALLTGVIKAAGHSGQREGAYFGLWNWVTKMNLALAAGIALPLLAALGYTPGAVDSQATLALRVAYGLFPCALKLVAAVLLLRSPLRGL